MHRCFFANEKISCKSSTPPPSPIFKSAISLTSVICPVTEKSWTFKVLFDWPLCSNEFLAISGSCTSLGNWKVPDSLPLKRSDNTSIWTFTIDLPHACEIHYRYFVCALDYAGRKIVRFWETHFSGRLIEPEEFQIVNSKEYEIFGVLNKITKIERGWLEPFTTVIQFKFHQNPVIPNSNLEEKKLKLKLTPIKLKEEGKKCEKLIQPWSKSVTTETCLDLNEEEESKEPFAFCEVALMQEQKGGFDKQAKYGTPYGRNHLIIFNFTVNVIEECAFLIDLYNLPENSGYDVPPNHFGYQYICPQDLRKTEDSLELTLMCGTRHRPIGSLKCDYLVIKPMKNFCNFNLEKTFQRYWNSKHQGLYCGHRGCGRSFWYQNNILRENTLKSFNVAIEHGAGMIELDIQLTKDLVPIIYHDPYLYVSQDFDIDLRENDVIHLPLSQEEKVTLKCATKKISKDLSLMPLSKLTKEQLSRVKVYEPTQRESFQKRCNSPADNNKPFVTLRKLLNKIYIKTGFVAKINWPQKLANGAESHLYPDFDKNEYVDTILSLVLKHAGSRPIIFSSNDAGICSMVRLKQNIYPIMFRIKSNGAKIYKEPIHNSIFLSVLFAHLMELWGICINCADVLNIPETVAGLQESGLRVFCDGFETRHKETRQHLKTLGVDGIICDRLNNVLNPLDLKRVFVYIIPLKDHKEKINEIEENI